MSSSYICRKCGHTYTMQEYTNERFCKNCGTWLFPSAGDRGKGSEGKQWIGKRVSQSIRVGRGLPDFGSSI